MTIRFSCTAGHKLSVPDDLAGRKVRCPTCNTKVSVPAQSTVDDGSTQKPPIAAPPVAAPPVAAVGSEPPVAAPLNKPPVSKPPVSKPPQTAAVPSADKAKAKPPAQQPSSKSPAPVAEQASVPVKSQSKPTKPKSNKQAKAEKKPAQPTQKPSSQTKPEPKKPETKKPGKESKSAKPTAATKGSTAQSKPAPTPAAPAAASSASATLSLPFPEAGTELPVVTGGRPSRSGVSVRTESDEYKAGSGRVQTTYLLALGVGGVASLAALPAFPHINLLEAPIWAIAVLVGFLLHALFVVWMVSLPDWSTVWLGGCVLSVTSLLYVAGAGMAAMSARWFGLAEMRGTAVSWSIVMCVLFALMAFACFRFASGWRREFEAMTPSGA